MGSTHDSDCGIAHFLKLTKCVGKQVWVVAFFENAGKAVVEGTLQFVQGIVTSHHVAGKVITIAMHARCTVAVPDPFAAYGGLRYIGYDACAVFLTRKEAERRTQQPLLLLDNDENKQRKEAQ